MHKPQPPPPSHAPARLGAALEGRHDVRLRDLDRPVRRSRRRLQAVALPLTLLHDVVELLSRQPDVRRLADAVACHISRTATTPMRRR